MTRHNIVFLRSCALLEHGREVYARIVRGWRAALGQLLLPQPERVRIPVRGTTQRQRRR